MSQYVLFGVVLCLQKSDHCQEPEPPTLVSEPEPEPELRPAKKPRRGGRRVKSAAMVSDDAIDDVFTPPPLADPEVVDPAASARQKVNSEWSEAEKGELEYFSF